MGMIDLFLFLKVIFISILIVLEIVLVGLLVSWLLEKAFGDRN